MDQKPSRIRYYFGVIEMLQNGRFGQYPGSLWVDIGHDKDRHIVPELFLQVHLLVISLGNQQYQALDFIGVHVNDLFDFPDFQHINFDIPEHHYRFALILVLIVDDFILLEILHAVVETIFR